MTALIEEREVLALRAFLKGGGALVVGFSILGSGVAQAAAAADPNQFASFGPADSAAIDSWIVINPDSTASVKLGKVELGQGSMTGLLMIAAEELNLELGQMHPITNDTDLTPNQGITAGSSSIRSGGLQTRAAAAAAYQALLGLASAQLGVPVGSLSVSKGVVTGGGQTVSYGQLLGGGSSTSRCLPLTTSTRASRPPRHRRRVSPTAAGRASQPARRRRCPRSWPPRARGSPLARR